MAPQNKIGRKLDAHMLYRFIIRNSRKNHHDCTPQSQEFQYYLTIITNAGFDTVELVCCVANDLCMTAQDLIELGITKPQHVKRIMQFVEQEKEERRKRGVDDHLVLSFESDQKDQRYRGYGQADQNDQFSKLR
eukprot:979223_1